MMRRPVSDDMMMTTGTSQRQTSWRHLAVAVTANVLIGANIAGARSIIIVRRSSACIGSRSSPVCTQLQHLNPLHVCQEGRTIMKQYMVTDIHYVGT